MLSVGMYLADRYEIVSKVGAGGMSDVYKAKDHILGRIVAIKVLKQEFSEDRTFVSKFRSEAQSAAGLEHPNVVNIYDVGSEDGLYYIVMEYVEGITLKTYVEKKGQLSFKEAASIAIQVARGIEAAHNKEIIHRDIKPQNIIISTEGKVKVTDFGIARAASSNTISADVMGSVHYASPEQARNGFVDGRSDIYSLGIVMYEMVTGRVPFDGDTTVAVAIQHLQEEMPEPTTYAPELPISFAKIILKCAQKNPDRRYQTVAELLTDLRRAMLNPDEDFVVIAPLVDNGKTKVISKEELDEIGKERKIDVVSISSPSETDEDELEEDLEDLEDLDEEEPVNPKMDKAITIVAIVAAVLIVVLIICISVSLSKAFKKEKVPNQSETSSVSESMTGSDTEDEEIAMIDLMGMTVEEANKALKEIGLDSVWVEKKVKSDKKEGTIIYQKNAVGEKMSPGSKVIVRIAGKEDEDYNGEEQVVSMIDVTGMTAQEATKALEEAGLKVKSPVTYVESDDDKKDLVIAAKSTTGATLKKGTTLNKGTEIVLEIGKGKDAVEVPAFTTEQSAATVEKLLKDAHFAVAEVSKQQESDTVEKGNVIEVLNADGKAVKPGDKRPYGEKLTLVVSTGKKEVKPVTYKTDDITVSKNEFKDIVGLTHINYVITDADGNVLDEKMVVADITKDLVIKGLTNLSLTNQANGTLKVEFYKVTEEQKNDDGTVAVPASKERITWFSERDSVVFTKEE